MPEDEAERFGALLGIPKIPIRFLLNVESRQQQRGVFPAGWKDSAIFYRLFGLANSFETPEGRACFNYEEWQTVERYLNAIRECEWVPMADAPSDEFMELEPDDLSSLMVPAKAILDLLNRKTR